ncbi:porin family protein [Flavobacterium agrisoli]|uniref:PorT family protein n=1 Tax=Flavobacterium agrisoli TaxID=2793066 RepID=A0A934PRA9_9FLAO|nr:porin family protein [Flavobacterium agrisoli]MBK0371233.1 PorT family protein [Flavobacterium agrisoli]
MKNKIGLLLFFISLNAQSQVLISLLFGDKLNSPLIEFGLEGGANFSTISNTESSGMNPGFNLGFYFDFKFKNNPQWMVNTGVIVKSPMGAKDIGVYSLNDADLDAVFANGNVNRELRYFNVPILIKHQFNNNIFLKAGPQFGLLSKAFDKFTVEVNKEDVEYKNKIRDQIHVVDAGIALGAGYHLNVAHGINLTLQYYHGLVPVMKGDGPNQYNRSLYITAGLPIGKAKALAKRKAENKDD